MLISRFYIPAWCRFLGFFYLFPAKEFLKIAKSLRVHFLASILVLEQNSIYS